MKFLLKSFLSRAAYSRAFFGIVERTYFYVVRMRYQRIDRSELVGLKQLISVNIQSKGLGLIRLGSTNDGGYVILGPETKGAEVISLGIADNLDFELALIDGGYVKEVHCFDGSITQLPDQRAGIHFDSRYVRTFSSRNSVLLKEILAKNEAKELILKIDIEGDEWDVFEALELTELCKFSQIIGEFHGLASSSTNLEVRRKREILQRLNQYFYLFNSHPNNWSEYRILQGVPLVDVVELSFVNKNHRLVKASNLSASSSIPLPGSLNSPCNPLRFEYLTS